MPTGTIATILVIAIFCNLVLMVAFLLGPLLRRGSPRALPAQHAAAVGALDEAAAEVETREAALMAIAFPPQGDALEGEPEEASAPRDADALDTRAGVTSDARSTVAGEAVTAAPMDISAPVDTEEEGETDLDQPEIEETERRRRFVFTRHDDPRAMRAIDALLSKPHANGRDAEATPVATPATNRPAPGVDANGSLADAETGLESILGWQQTFRDETARHVRYRRPVTVVVAELDGFERLVRRFGRDAAGRLVPPIAETLRRHARGSDRVARVAASRFYVLLPETDEIQAINYVERVRAECDRWLEAGAIGAHLIFGWASPATGVDLPGALGVAERRLEAERRLHADPHPPAGPAPRRAGGD